MHGSAIVCLHKETKKSNPNICLSQCDLLTCFIYLFFHFLDTDVKVNNALGPIVKKGLLSVQE